MEHRIRVMVLPFILLLSMGCQSREAKYISLNKQKVDIGDKLAKLNSEIWWLEAETTFEGEAALRIKAISQPLKDFYVFAEKLNYDIDGMDRDEILQGNSADNVLINFTSYIGYLHDERGLRAVTDEDWNRYFDKRVERDLRNHTEKKERPFSGSGFQLRKNRKPWYSTKPNNADIALAKDELREVICKVVEMFASYKVWSADKQRELQDDSVYKGLLREKKDAEEELERIEEMIYAMEKT